MVRQALPLSEAIAHLRWCSDSGDGVDHLVGDGSDHGREVTTTKGLRDLLADRPPAVRVEHCEVAPRRVVEGDLGSSLAYRNGDQVLVVDVATAGTLTLGYPKVLYEKRSVSGELNLMPDGQSFVMIDDSATERGPTQLNLVLNWSHELERLTTP